MINEILNGMILPFDNELVTLLRCPKSAQPLTWDGTSLRSADGRFDYPLPEDGIPGLMVENPTPATRIQQQHYDKVSAQFIENLGYPHTQEYLAYLDEALARTVGPDPFERTAEICCGAGEAITLFGERLGRTVAVDVSRNMLRVGRRQIDRTSVAFIQGDATDIPMLDDSVEAVFIIGGIHHVNDRDALFGEVYRILKPGGRFFWREPVSDFFLWRWLRAVIYRLSPALDHDTESPLLYEDTVPVLERAGLKLEQWRTYGVFGFALFMNSDVLVFNRLFRFIPGIRAITRLFARLDDWITNTTLFQRSGMIVIGSARKPD